MIKVFYGADGRTVLAKAISEIDIEKPYHLFPEIAKSASSGHSSKVRYMNIAVPASPHEILEVVKELAELEKGTKDSITVATCSPAVLVELIRNCKEVKVIDCY
jgi:hypothetical protein